MNAAPAKVLAALFVRLPDWGKFTVVGAVLIILTVLSLGFPMERAEAAYDAAKTLQIKVEAQQKQLDRIEEKLDRLTIHLIPK